MIAIISRGIRSEPTSMTPAFSAVSQKHVIKVCWKETRVQAEQPAQRKYEHKRHARALESMQHKGEDDDVKNCGRTLRIYSEGVGEELGRPGVLGWQWDRTRRTPRSRPRSRQGQKRGGHYG